MKKLLLASLLISLFSCENILLEQDQKRSSTSNSEVLLPSLTNLETHLDSDSLSLTTGDEVFSWSGQSSSANAGQVVSSMSPLFEDDGIKTSVNFDGIDDNLSISNSDVTLSTGYTIFVVMNVSNLGRDQYLLSKGLDSEDRFRIFISSTGFFSTELATSNSTVFSQSIVNYGSLEIHVLKMIDLGGGSFKFQTRQNGTLRGTSTLGVFSFPSNNSDIVIGAKESSSGVLDSHFDGKISEFIMYDEDFSDANILDLECQLSQKYSIVISHACP